MNEPIHELEAYFAGHATEEQFRAVEAWINEGPDNAKTFMEQLHFREVVGQHLREQVDHASIALSELARLEDQADPMLVTLHDGRDWKNASSTSVQWHGAVRYLLSHTFTPRRLMAGGIAAALLLGAVLAIVLLTAGPDDPPAQQIVEIPVQPEVSVATPMAVATLTAEHDAKWDRAPGHDLFPGERFTLQTGFARVMTNRGAVAILQAPCTIELTDNDNAIRLHSGKLVGICETPRSKGFTVHTQGMDVVDLGTKFGVSTQRDGVSTVRVIEGEVRAQPTAQSPQAFEPVVLLKDEARRVVPETGALEVVAASEAPVFHAEPVHAYVAAVLEAKPVLWLRQNEFDGATLLGGARFESLDERFSAVQLDGKSGVDLGDVLDFEADQPMSFVGWVRLKDAQADAFILGRVASNAEQGFHGYDLYLKDQHLRFQLTHSFEAVGQADAQLRVEASEPLMAGRWCHVAVTYDGSRQAAGVRMFIDGQPTQMKVRDETLGESSILAETTLRLGIRGFAQPQPGLAFNTLDTVAAARIGSPMIGSLGDFVVFQRPLSAEEVSVIHSLSESGYSED